MRSPYPRLSVAVLLGFLVFFLSCERGSTKQLAPQYINLSNQGGTCTQNGSPGIIDIYQNQVVVFQGATAANAVTQFQVQFGSCPFNSCPVTSQNGGPINAGQPKAGSAGTTFNYTSLTISNQPCNLPSPMGLRIKPGP